jgi:outer membrane protein assembly factor BamB
MRRRTSISVPALVVGFFLAGSLLGPMPALAAPPPVITKFNPKSGIVGTEVTITGTGLAGATSVTFNGTPDSTFIVDSATKIAAHVPFGATTGPISVTTPVGTATSAANFTVIASPAIGLTPTAGPPGSSISVAGSGFGAFEPVDLYFDITDEALASTDGSGNFSMSMPVPPDALPGTHWVTAVGRRTLTSFQAAFVVRTNWSQYRNTRQRTARNPNERILNAANVDGLDTKWSFTTGANIEFSSPAVANGVVYIGSADHRLYAFNAKGCGKSACLPLWAGTTGNGIIESSPLVVNGVVYVGSFDKKLYAFSASGCGKRLCTPLWTAATGGRITSSPAFSNGVVYIGSENGKLYAFAAAGCGASACSPLWTAKAGSSISQSSPAIAKGVVYIGSFDGGLYAFNAAGCGAATCSPLWIGNTGPFIASSPSVANGVVYVGDGDAIFYAFRAAGCGTAACAPLWSGDAVGEQAAIISSPAVANGLVYVGENNGMVMVFDANGCGSSFCQPINQLLTSNEQIVSSSPAVVNGTVYFGSANEAAPPIGRLYVYKLLN